MLGKFAGHVSILAIATGLGYGTAGVAAMLNSADFANDWSDFAALMVSSMLLGAVFIAIGYVVSALVRDRGAAGGIAIGVWLILVLVYDMALLGVLVVDQGRFLSEAVVNWLLLFNPTDTYRLFNLAGTTQVGAFSGMAGLAAQAHLGPASLIGVLLAWCAVPLLAATWVFSRREI
jgi:Cu-processing system permease protein